VRPAPAGGTGGRAGGARPAERRWRGRAGAHRDKKALPTPPHPHSLLAGRELEVLSLVPCSVRDLEKVC